MKELTKRILVAIFGVPVILGLSYLGGHYFLALILVINALALWEFYTMFSNQKIQAYRNVGVGLSTILILLAYQNSIQLFVAGLFGILILLYLRHLRLTGPNASMNTVFTVGGIFYITIFLIGLLNVRQNFAGWFHTESISSPGGNFLVILWVSIWICDTMAYFGGRLLGRHKLAPRTSPNKTVEGAVFGVLGAVFVFVAGGSLILSEIPGIYFWIAGGIVGIFGQLGDLVESRFKRDAGVKDTSTILPGHGGFLDRFDSFIFVSPFFYLLFTYFRFW